MKTQRRRGFTVVELVVVIAIIAVLAAVLIPTFTSIIKKANDSAYLQERQSQQIEDLAEKVDKMNYLSWEDFEKKLATELAKIGTTDTAEIQAAVKAAMDQYQASQSTQDTKLTEDQVKKIVNEALSGQLTTAQVEAIVNAAVSKNPTTSGLTEAQVKQIVNSAIAKIPTQTGISKTEMQNAITAAIAEAGTGLTEKQVKAIVEKALAGFSTLTAEEVEQIVNAAIAASTPTTDTVYIAGDMELAAGKTYILRTMNALGTVTLTVPNGVEVEKIIIDAPNVQTVDIVYADNTSAKNAVKSIEILSTASTSTHIDVNALDVIINKGRVVVEGGATVGTLTAAPSTNADVVVELSTGSAVTNPIVAEYQDHGANTGDTITIIDNTNTANVKLAASTELDQSGTTTTNVVVKDVSVSKITVDNSVKDSENISSSTMTLDVETTGDTPTSTSYFVDPESTEPDKDTVAITLVSNYTELFEAITSNKKYIKFTADISYLTNGTNDYLNIKSSTTIDGNGFTLSGYGKRSNSSYPTIVINHQGTQMVDVVLKNMTISNSKSSTINGDCRPIEARGNISSITLDGVNIECTSNGNHQGLTIGGSQYSKAKVVIKNSKINAGNSGYPIVCFNPIDATLMNSDFIGYCSLYFKGVNSSAGSRGSVVEASACSFDSPNYHSGSSDSFGVFVLEDDGVSISIDQCWVNSAELGYASQEAFCLSSNASRTTTKCHFVIDGTTTVVGKLISVHSKWAGDSFDMTIKGGDYLSDPSDYVDTTAYNVTESGGVWTVTAK